MQHFWRHPPDPVGGRQDRAADRSLAFRQDVDERLAVEAQRDRPPQFLVVERRHGRLINRSRLLLSITTSQTACGAWLLRSFSSGIVEKMKSSLPATKARSHVAGLAMIVYSIPSRYGLPFFQ